MTVTEDQSTDLNGSRNTSHFENESWIEKPWKKFEIVVFRLQKRVFSIISGKTTMTKLGKCRKFQASNSWPRRALPCLVPGNIYRIPRKALPNRRICLSPRLFCVAGTTSITPVHVVTIVVGGTIPSPGFCTTLEI